MNQCKHGQLERVCEMCESAATIEALQLRIAHLTDALYRIAVHGDDTAPETMRRTAKQALSAEGDQQWLREKQADIAVSIKADLNRYKDDVSDEAIAIVDGYTTYFRKL